MPEEDPDGVLLGVCATQLAFEPGKLAVVGQRLAAGRIERDEEDRPHRKAVAKRIVAAVHHRDARMGVQPRPIGPGILVGLPLFGVALVGRGIVIAWRDRYWKPAQTVRDRLVKGAPHALVVQAAALAGHHVPGNEHEIG